MKGSFASQCVDAENMLNFSPDKLGTLGTVELDHTCSADTAAVRFLNCVR